MRTNVENLVFRETQRKQKTVCENTVSSISKLLTLSHLLYLKAPVWWFFKGRYVHVKLIGAEVGPYTDNNDGHKSSRTPRVECQVYEWHQTFFPSIVKLFISFSYFELRSHFRDGIKTLK